MVNIKNNLENKDISNVLIDNYMPYSAHVIMDRALPEIDGFKPSQRRILYTMYKMGLLNGDLKKSQGIVGQTMFIHGHGDMSIYETMVRMSVDAESLTIPFVESKGNFGKQYSRDMQFASPRYTQAKLTDISKELFRGIESNSAEMIDSYDGTHKEPRLLPVAFPTILTNPQTGMAVSMSSSIAPFNLREVIEYTISRLENKDESPTKYITSPDFPTGENVIRDNKALKEILNTGRGSFKLRATYGINEEDNSIIFYNIPYTTTFEAIIDKITDLVKDDKLREIVDINDIYGINSKGIEVVARKNTDLELLAEKLFQMTSLESSFSCNFNVIIDGRPKVSGVKEIIDGWIKYRKETVIRESKFVYEKLSKEIEEIVALELIMNSIDEIIELIRGSKNDEDAIKKLMGKYPLNERQAEYIINIRLKRLNGEYINKMTKKKATLEKEANELDQIINDEGALSKRIIDELEGISEKYGQDHKTSLIDVKDIPKITTEEVEVENYNVRVFLTKLGYIKKIPSTSLRGNYSIRLRDGDEIVSEYNVDNMSEILVFTNNRIVHKIKAYELENCRPSDLGVFAPTLLNLDNEKILFMTATKDFDENLIIGFDDGRVAKIDMKAYKTKQNRSMLRNAYADKKPMFFAVIEDDVDLMAVSSDKKAVILNTDVISEKSSRSVSGNMFIRLRDDCKVKSYKIVDTEKDKSLEYYRIQSSGIGKYLK